MSDTKSENSTYEGLQAKIREWKAPPIDIFENIYKDRRYRIHIEIPEFSAICPKTQLPDYGTVYLNYQPDAYCLELKSLKEYILAYRNLGIFQENVSNRIRDDVIQACKPHFLRVLVDYRVRGGIHTRVTSTYNF